MLRRALPLALSFALFGFLGCNDEATDTVAPEPRTVPPTSAGPDIAPAGEPATTEESVIRGIDTPPIDPPAGTDTPPGDTAAVDVTLSEEEIDEIKTLPEEDAALALTQKICPISDEHLGSMGTPIKVEADGKTAFLCCGGCKKLFESDPDAALAKLGLK